MRSPSGSAPGSMRGRAPVDTSTTSALRRVSPTATVCGPASRPVPVRTSIPSAASRAVTSADCAQASARTLAYSRGASTVARAVPAEPGPQSRRMPRAAAPSSAAIMPEVAISVLDGTQSVSTQAPPSPSRSTTVTLAPSCAATRAAS